MGNLLQAEDQLPCPAAKGVYFYDQGKWIEMEQVHSNGVQTSGVAKTAVAYGLLSGRPRRHSWER